MWLGLFKSPAFGLDISDYSVELISLTGFIEKPRLSAMGRVILDPGVVENGKILDKKRLAESLRRLTEKPKFGRLKTKNLIFALPESKSFIHIADLPNNLKQKEEKKYIQFQISQTFPFSLEELYLDSRIRRRDGLSEVILVAVCKEIVDEYLEVFENLKLRPFCLTIESESLSRALIDTKDPVLITDIGARTTNFSLFVEKELKFSFDLGLAGNQFTKSLAERLKIPIEKAEILKKKVGLNPELEEGKVFLTLQRSIQKIIWEINKIEKYFREKENKEIQKIILAGGSAMLPYLPEYLVQNLQKPVIIGDPWTKINIDILKKKEYFQEALEINPLLYATCIGSALRGLVKKPKTAGINLLK